jgi:hypothetical protein
MKYSTATAAKLPRAVGRAYIVGFLAFIGSLATLRSCWMLWVRDRESTP